LEVLPPWVREHAPRTVVAQRIHARNCMCTASQQTENAGCSDNEHDPGDDLFRDPAAGLMLAARPVQAPSAE
jgi:hypothetical protein